jgi:transposase
MERVDIWLEHRRGATFACPTCAAECRVYDHGEEREWRHLPICDMETWVHARLPRISCGSHGVLQAGPPWAEPGSDLTWQMEGRMIDLAKECPIEAVSRLSGLSWDRCWGVTLRAVRRGLARRGWQIPKRIGVDEKTVGRGHDYQTLVYDLAKKTVHYVAESREGEALDGYYSRFSDKERESVQTVVMDMHQPYIRATEDWIPEAETKIVFDKFHVMKTLNDALDKVRRQEHKALMAEGDDTLKHTRYLWLYNPENIPEKRVAEFDELRQWNLQTARAWAIRETLTQLWTYRCKGWARRFFKRWYYWATHSQLAPIIAAAKTLKRHLENILTYIDHELTNAVAEAINSRIEQVRRMARGFRNRKNIMLAIYFHAGGLDLYPRPATSGAPCTTRCGGYPF